MEFRGPLGNRARYFQSLNGRYARIIVTRSQRLRLRLHVTRQEEFYLRQCPIDPSRRIIFSERAKVSLSLSLSLSIRYHPTPSICRFSSKPVPSCSIDFLTCKNKNQGKLIGVNRLSPRRKREGNARQREKNIPSARRRRREIEARLICRTVARRRPRAAYREIN